MSQEETVSSSPPWEESYAQSMDGLRIIVALADLDGTELENLIAVRTGLTASRVREVLVILQANGIVSDELNT